MNKLIYRFCTYHPVIDLFSHRCTQYHENFGNQVYKLKGIVANQKEVEPKELKQFFIDQYRENQYKLVSEKEVLFVGYIGIYIAGRSNVGKSSLINGLFGEKVSRVSKSPGCTKKLYFHYLPKLHGYVIDAPGYGYADVSFEAVKKWQGMIEQYIKLSPNLCRIYVLINLEHGIKSNDEYILEQMSKHNINMQIVLTKCDKLKDNEIYDRMLMIANFVNKRYKNIHPLLHTVSARNQFGITQMKHSLIETFNFHQSRDVEGVEDVVIKYLQAQKREPKLNIKEIIRKQNKTKLKLLT